MYAMHNTLISMLFIDFSKVLDFINTCSIIDQWTIIDYGEFSKNVLSLMSTEIT